ncbi:MAG: NAD(P)/FAD-dependent oxidoreductase [Alphaproteobacteria bacterium]
MTDNATVNGPVAESVKEIDFDTVIVGAGFAGLYMLHKLRSLGQNVHVYDAAGGVGGTWYWNRYPGARCDVPSMEYSYQFDEDLQQEWDWTERYATQGDILKYLEHVAERFDLKRDITFNMRVDGASFDEETCTWSVNTGDGKTVRSRFFIMATGCLSKPHIPDIEGLDSFKGPVIHTGRWPKEPVEIEGKRIAVIGTGSSSIQVAPELAKTAKHLMLLQRTPAYTVPNQNRPLWPDEKDAIKRRYKAFRDDAHKSRAGILYTLGEKSALEVDEEELDREYQKKWEIGGLGFTAAFHDIYDNVEANKTAADFVRKKIRSIVRDPEVVEKLIPTTLIGCKRLCVDAGGYFEMFNRDNVSLVDLREEPIVRVTPNGIVVGERELEVDIIVLGTGFDAFTGALLNVDLHGRTGKSLKQKWEDGPKTYLGHSIAGFPNMFAITGPGSPSALSNFLPSIEQDVNWIGACIKFMQDNNYSCIEASEEAEDEWVKHVQEVADASIYPLENSWYVGTNIPGKPRVFLPYIGYPSYVERCNAVAEDGYKGYSLM